MRKLILTKVLWLGAIFSAMAQVNESPAWSNFSVASPDHSYIATQVNEATGQPQIAIPLFQLTNYGFSHTIFLNYRTGGFKVDESSSRIGLGWNLSIGGSITKVVCGLPDDKPLEGYEGVQAQYSINYVLNNNNINSVPNYYDFHFDRIYKGSYDGETDYYVYNAPGISGKYFKSDGNAYSLPYDNVKMEEGTYLGVADSYKITDQNGVVYYFTEKEYVEIDAGSTVLSPETSNTRLLKKIKLLNGAEINFIYGTEFVYVVKGGTFQSQKIELPNGNQCFISYENIHDVTTQQLTYKYRTKKLIQVVLPLGEVAINYNPTVREDIPNDYAISSIVLKDQNANTLNQFVLNQYYVTNTGSIAGKRLMLGSVQEFGANGLDSKPPYTFLYNTTPLPSPGSCSQDLYGYYNGENVLWSNNLGAPFPIMLQAFNQTYNLSSTQLGYPAAIAGATRAISSFYTQAMVLNSLSYPSGGKTLYEYEQNTLQLGSGYGPGLRIKKITTNDGNGAISYKHYLYIYGVLVSYAENQIQNYLREISTGCTVRVFKRYTMPGKTIPGIFNAPMYYKTVTVKESSDADGATTNGAIVSNYYAEDVVPPNNGFGGGYTGILHLKPYFFGALLNRKVYKDGGTILLDETNYEYNLDEPTPKSFRYSIYPRVNMVVPSSSNLYFRIRPNSAAFFAAKIYSQVFHLKKVTHKTYGTEGTDFSLSQNEYFYEPHGTAVHLLPMQSKTTYEDGSTLSTFFKRVNDYNTVSATDAASIAIQQLKNNNQKGIVIEQTAVKNEGASNEKLLGGSISEYVKPDPNLPLVSFKREYLLNRFLQSSSNTFVPSTISSGIFSFDPHYKNIGEVNQYNANGEVISQNQKGFYSCQFISPRWDRAYAKASNASIQEFAYAGFENFEFEQNASATSPTYPVYQKLGNWQIPISSTATCNAISSTAFAGSASLNLQDICGISLGSTLSLDPLRKYTLSLWCKNGVPAVTIGNAVQSGSLTQTTEGWNLYQYDFMGVSTILIQGTCLLDEVKIKPIDANIETLVLNQLGLKMAESDNNNNYTFYEYDGLNRPVKLLDQQRNIIRKMDYSIQQTQN